MNPLVNENFRRSDNTEGGKGIRYMLLSALAIGFLSSITILSMLIKHVDSFLEWAAVVVWSPLDRWSMDNQLVVLICSVLVMGVFGVVRIFKRD